MEMCPNCGTQMEGGACPNCAKPDHGDMNEESGGAGEMPAGEMGTEETQM